MCRTVLLILAAIATSTVALADDWWNPDWKVRHRIDINEDVITEDLENFPLRIRIAGPNCMHDPTTLGKDARVVDELQTELPIEIVQWDADGIELYAGIPKLSTKGSKDVLPLSNELPKTKPINQRLYLYYGNPNATAAPNASVWDDSYVSVLHLRGNANDVVGDGNSVTPVGSVELENSGAIFSEQPGYLNYNPEILSSLEGDFTTIAIRFRMVENPGLQCLVSGQRTGEPKQWFNFGIKTPNFVHTNATSDGKQAPEMNPAGIAPGEWHSAVIRYDARNHSRTICIDGTVFERDEALPGPLRINEMRIGRGVLHFEPWQFHGTIDEVRIANVARSDSWLKAEASSLADLNVFSPVGMAQAQGEAEPVPAVVHLLRPAEDVEWRKRGPLELTWAPSAGAESYTLTLTTNRSGELRTDKYEGLKNTSFELYRGIMPAIGKKYNREHGYLNSNVVTALDWSVSATGPGGTADNGEKRHVTVYSWTDGLQAKLPMPAAQPALKSANESQFDLHGYLRTRIDNAIDEYLISTPSTSPAILQVLRDRDKTPMREPLVPWAGEFAGKYLTSAQLTWRLTRDEELKNVIDKFVKDLIACQQEDGYLGPFPKSSRITGGNWDVWGHYHCMLGLLLYYEDTRYEPALEACKNAADLLFETFGPGGPSLINDGGGGQMNMAVGHGLVLLYNKTGIDRYLDLAKYVVHEAWNDAGAGRYLESALAGKPIVEFPQHRWEAIHDWQALPELYWLTGDEQYKKAYEHMWWSAVKGDRHNTGGLTSGEGFTGSPFNTGAIETCCTVAWLAMSIDMLRLTGDARVADEIELSTLNSALGAIPYAGRSCAYNVPMNGTRLFGVELHWQAPKGGPDLNCCSVNANRPLGMISEWALMEKDRGLAINFYGPCTMKATLPSGNRVTIEQDTQYPSDGKVSLKLTLDKPETFPLFVRVPRWSKSFNMRANGGGEARKYSPGHYSGEEREWKTGDVIELDFDFTPHFWAGQESFANTVSFYRGPILYAYDARYNALNPSELPKIDPATAQFTAGTFVGDAIPPWIYGTINAADGTPIHVVDLSSAGQTGNQYVSWLPATGPPVSEVVPYAANAR